jgi:microcompartment protein CcmK/EutM
MIICRALGSVTATVKHEGYSGRKIMIVQPVDSVSLAPAGASFLAVDTVSAGPGELVLVNKEGGSSLIAVRDSQAPIHSTITAIIDDISERI